MKHHDCYWFSCTELAKAISSTMFPSVYLLHRCFTASYFSPHRKTVTTLFIGVVF